VTQLLIGFVAGGATFILGAYLGAYLHDLKRRTIADAEFFRLLSASIEQDLKEQREALGK